MPRNPSQMTRKTRPQTRQPQVATSQSSPENKMPWTLDSYPLLSIIRSILSVIPSRSRHPAPRPRYSDKGIRHLGKIPLPFKHPQLHDKQHNGKAMIGQRTKRSVSIVFLQGPKTRSRPSLGSFPRPCLEIDPRPYPPPFRKKSNKKNTRTTFRRPRGAVPPGWFLRCPAMMMTRK